MANADNMENEVSDAAEASPESDGELLSTEDVVNHLHVMLENRAQAIKWGVITAAFMIVLGGGVLLLIQPDPISEIGICSVILLVIGVFVIGLNIYDNEKTSVVLESEVERFAAGISGRDFVRAEELDSWISQMDETTRRYAIKTFFSS